VSDILKVVPRVRWKRMSFVTGVACVLGLGCSSSTPPLAPIPDPGGPFHTSVPTDTRLDALTGDQWQELCGEVSAAEKAYLVSAISAESVCRELSFEILSVAADGGVSPIAADAGSFLSACQARYDDCEQQNLTASPPPCGLEVTGCGATVELLSACLNEIANTNPVAACVTLPTCAEAAAAGTTRSDAGSRPFGTCPNDSKPSLPACARLQPQCPGVLLSNNPYGD
jgi:hypothetical protein